MIQSHRIVAECISETVRIHTESELALEGRGDGLSAFSEKSPGNEIPKEGCLL